jgi:hypothetical protein
VFIIASAPETVNRLFYAQVAAEIFIARAAIRLLATPMVQFVKESVSKGAGENAGKAEANDCRQL